MVDVFHCRTEFFTPNDSFERDVPIAQLSAGFNRSTLLIDVVTPDASPTESYTDQATYDHARVVQSANADGGGDAFLFDGVKLNGWIARGGAVRAPNPKLLTAVVGGYA